MIWQMTWTPAHQYFVSSVKRLPRITQLIHRKIRTEASDSNFPVSSGLGLSSWFSPGPECFSLLSLFLGALPLCCCVQAFSSCREQGLFSLWNTGYSAQGLSGWGTQLSCTWNPPRPGIKPTSPALAGGFLTTGPPRKSVGTS